MEKDILMFNYVKSLSVLAREKRIASFFHFSNVGGCMKGFDFASRLRCLSQFFIRSMSVSTPPCFLGG